MIYFTRMTCRRTRPREERKEILCQVRLFSAPSGATRARASSLIFSQAQADLVVRSQGGNNAGHTVVVNGETYKLQLIPSGILYPDCINVIGPGVVVNPKAVLGEIDGLHEKGVSTDKLFIDARCHCILPWHLELDALSEAEKAKEGTAIGTTKKGIGPTYMDKSERSGIRMHDFVDADRFEDRHPRDLRAQKPRDHRRLRRRAGRRGRGHRGIPRLCRPPAPDGARHHGHDLGRGQGGQGGAVRGRAGHAARPGHGHLPLSSPPRTRWRAAAASARASARPPSTDIMGIFKSYTTRVGEGPFPTELFDETGDYIRKAGGEFGTVTGRPRRTGWFDAVIARYAVRVNGLTEVGHQQDRPAARPAQAQGLRGLQAEERRDRHRVPGELHGSGRLASRSTRSSTALTRISRAAARSTSCRRPCRAYIKELERIMGCPITMLGVGPARDQVMTIK